MAPKQPVAGPSKPRTSVNAPAQSPPPPPSLSSFSPSGDLFALAHPALGSADKISVWDVESDQLLSEWEVEGASKVSAICWGYVPAVGSHIKKRRRKEAVSGETEEIVVICTTKGKVFTYLPTKGVHKRFDLPQPAVASVLSEKGVIITSSTAIYLLSSDISSVSSTIQLPSNISPPTAITILPSTDSLQLVLSSSSVTILTIDSSFSKITATSPAIPVSTSSVTFLHSLSPTSEGSSFLVVSDDDRTVSQYTTSPSTTKPKLSHRYASPTLSAAHSVSCSSSAVSILHSSGEISLFPIPAQLDLARPKSDNKPRSVKLVEGKNEIQSRVCRILLDKESLTCGRMLGGGRIKWVKIDISGDDSEFKVKSEAQDLIGLNEKTKGKLQRYSAPLGTTEAPDLDESEDKVKLNELPTDVDMADLSLGERLLAIPGATNGTQSNKPSTIKAGGNITNGTSTRKKRERIKPLPVLEGAEDDTSTTQSLTRILIQALHTSDISLLTVCLSQRDPVLIRNTIRKLPPQLALPLLKACIERLGQGKGANTRGGSKGTAPGEQSGRGIVEWVKGILVERGSVLMTMPSLPAHLASLSKLLDTRLQLYQPLLSLSGRLDLALAQIQMRRIAIEQSKGSSGKGFEGGKRYVEGESDDSSDEEEVEIEEGEEVGEVEDINIKVNGYSDESGDEDGVIDDEDESDDEEDDEDDDESDEDEDEDALESGDEDDLLDLEAEEGSESEEEESEEE